jgi:hypothetical protein
MAGRLAAVAELRLTDFRGLRSSAQRASGHNSVPTDV